MPAAVLRGSRFAGDVRAAELQWQRAGIHSVPSIVIDQRQPIQGGQSPQIFEQALRRIAAVG